MHLRLGSVDHDLTTRALVMGVLDDCWASFDVRSPASLDPLLGRTAALVGEGADLVDLGGVTTPVGAVAVGEDEELDRLISAVEALRARFDVPLAIDTWRPRVLVAAAAAGAAVAADAQRLGGADYLHAACESEVAIVLTPTAVPGGPASAGPGQAGIVEEVRRSLAERVARARAGGIADERMIVDAALDAGRTPAQSLALLRASAALADLGPPLLLDASNKRFLGLLLDLDVGERRLASHAAAALGVARGCRLIRAHDVRGARRVADVLGALLGARLTQVAPGRPAEVTGA